MLFCGNCGFRLNPGDRQCPRCGTAVEPDLLAGAEDAQPDAPTTASPSLLGSMQPPTMRPSAPPGDQPKLILRPGQDVGNYGAQDVDAATRRVDASSYDYGTGMRRAPSNADMHTSYPGYPQAGGNTYAPQPTPYLGYQQGINDYTQAPPTQFAPQTNTGYQSYPGQYQQQGFQAQAAKTNAKGKSAALVIILLGLLLIFVAMVLFFLQHSGIIASNELMYNSARNVLQYRL
jgi:hypothetical protein